MEINMTSEQRSAHPEQPELQPHFNQANNQRTILDYLNEDCWRAVLKYLPVKDIVRSEPTSKHWQRVVLEYLSHVRIRVRLHDCYTKIAWLDHQLLVMIERWDNSPYYPYYPSFKSWTHKLGSSVVNFEISNDIDHDIMEAIRKNCPNLKVITMFALEEPLPSNSNNTDEYFHNLEQLDIDCEELTDDSISQFLSSPALEELCIVNNKRVTGQCLVNLKSSILKSLVFRNCSKLKCSPFLSISDRLGGLTKLVLGRAGADIGNGIHLLLDKLPKLEYLTLLTVGDDDYENIDSNKFFESVCRLRELKHLNTYFCTEDSHLEAVTRCCKQLEVLKLCCEYVTGHGVAAMCRDVCARLTALDISHSRVTTADVVSLVYACPNLKWLRLKECTDLDESFLVLAELADARRGIGAVPRLLVITEYDWCGLDERSFADAVEIGLDALYDSDDVEFGNASDSIDDAN